LVLADEAAPEINIDAIYFNIDASLWPNKDAQRVRCVYRLDINEYRGQEKLQFLIQYMAAI